MFKKIVFNTAAQAIGRVVILLISLLTTAVLTRSLGVEGYGSYAFITAFVLLFATVSDWGTNVIAVREASQKKESRPVVFGATTLFRLGLSGIAVFLLNLVIRLNPEWQGLVVPATIGSLVLLVLSIKTSVGIVFQVLLRYEFAVMVEIFSSLIFLSLVLLSVSIKAGLLGVMFSWFAATTSASLAGLVFARRLSAISWILDKKVVKRIFWQAAPAGMLFLFFNLYNRIDTVILQYFKGPEAVGIYSLSYKVFDNLVLGAAFLMNSMFPLLSSSFAKGARNKNALNYYQKAFDLLLIGAVFVSLALFFLAPLVIEALGGREFLPSVSVLRILTLAVFVAYFNHLTGYSLIALGRQRVSMFIALGALVLNVVANLIFVPLFSYTAAAWITVATEGFVLLLSTVVIKRILGTFPKPFSFFKTWTALVKGDQIF